MMLNCCDDLYFSVAPKKLHEKYICYFNFSFIANIFLSQNAQKWALPLFSESLKGVVTKKFCPLTPRPPTSPGLGTPLAFTYRGQN